MAENTLPAPNSKLYLLITLSALTAFAPLVTDMYLPCLPTLTDVFNTSASMVQLTISTSMLGIAIGQLLFGTISDKTGRRKPLFVSFCLYLSATVGCVFSPNIYVLIAFRLLQGFGAAGGIVIARSVAADWFTGNDLLKFLAIMAAVQGIAPMAAPVAGGTLLLFTNWQGIFLCLGLVGLAVLVMALFMKESHPIHKRANVSVYSTFKFFVPVLKNKQLMLYVALTSAASALMFAYIGSSPFIFQQHYGLSPMAFSIIFAVNAACPACGSILFARFGNPKKALKIATVGLLFFSLLTSIALLLEAALVWLYISLVPTLICTGGIFPIASNLALDLEKNYKGTASAMLGALTFFAGGVVMPLAGLGNILHSTAYTMSGSALLAVILLWVVNKNEFLE
jgi:DHA1 family bicyclomycin/chloramphenicol resistance-like MFS transporter